MCVLLFWCVLNLMICIFFTFHLNERWLILILLIFLHTWWYWLETEHLLALIWRSWTGLIWLISDCIPNWTDLSWRLLVFLYTIFDQFWSKIIINESGWEQRWQLILNCARSGARISIFNIIAEKIFMVDKLNVNEFFSCISDN